MGRAGGGLQALTLPGWQLRHLDDVEDRRVFSQAPMAAGTRWREGRSSPGMVWRVVTSRAVAAVGLWAGLALAGGAAAASNLSDMSLEIAL